MSVQAPIQQTKEFLAQKPDFSEDVSKLKEFAADNAKWFKIAGWLVGATVLVLAGLLVSGRIDEFYEMLWSTCCWGEPWTNVMRRVPFAYPTVFLIPTVGLARYLPLRVGTRIIVVWVTFFVGFLGGHVFW
ncbi:MAG: hypothetical protein R3C39_09465 [Dehalococcoidia bacterium]